MAIAMAGMRREGSGVPGASPPPFPYAPPMPPPVTRREFLGWASLAAGAAALNAKAFAMHDFAPPEPG